MTFSLTLSMPSACPASQGRRSWNLPLWHWQPVRSSHEFSSTIESPSQSGAWDSAPRGRGYQGRGMSLGLSTIGPHGPADARLTVDLPHLA